MQYLVAIHHPDNYNPSLEDEAMMRDIHLLNEEMMAAGVRLFAGGLQSAAKAKSLRAQPNGAVLLTDGRRVLVAGDCQSGRGFEVGAQGRDCLPGAG